MALYFIERLHGKDIAEKAARASEYEWHKDSSWDPFTDMIEAERQGEYGRN